MAQCEGRRAQMVKVFLVFSYLAETCCEIPQVLGAPRNENPARFVDW